MLDFLAAGTGAAAGPAGFLGGIGGFVPIIGMIAIFYFLLIRPQMRQQKDHRTKIAGVKKGDQVVTGGGVVGKVGPSRRARTGFSHGASIGAIIGAWPSA